LWVIRMWWNGRRNWAIITRRLWISDDSRLYREERQYELQPPRLLSEIYIPETQIRRVYATTKDGIDDDETVQEDLWIIRRHNYIDRRFWTEATSKVQRTHQGEGIPIPIPTIWIQGLSCRWTQDKLSVCELLMRYQNTQNIGKMMLSRDKDGLLRCKNGMSCGTEIQMERSISGGLRWEQSYSERDQSIWNEQSVQSVVFPMEKQRPKIYTKIRFHFKCRTVA
jgi:hypothetical protein